MEEERFEHIDLTLGGFSFGMKQDMRNLLSILIQNKISNPEFIEYVNKLFLKSYYDTMKNPPVKPLPKFHPIDCPGCKEPMLYRVIRSSPYGYRSNFACEICGFDHYDARSVPEVLNEGIGINVPESSVEGSTAEPVVGEE